MSSKKSKSNPLIGLLVSTPLNDGAAVALSGILCTFIGMLFTTSIGSAFAVALLGTGVIVLLDEHLLTVNTQRYKKH